MAITHVGSAAGIGDPTTVMTVVVPACSNGDIMHAWFVTRQDVNAPTVTDDGSGGTWVSKIDSSPTSGTSQSMFARAVAAGDSGCTITGTGGGANGSANGVCVFRGCGDPIQITSFNLASGRETTTGLTTSTGSWFIIALFNYSNDIGVTGMTGANCGALTPLFEHKSLGGSDCALAVWGIEYTGDTGDISWTQSNGGTRGYVFELPLAGGSTYTLAADSGSYTVTGTDANLEFGREVAAGAGSYLVTGTDADLTYTPIVSEIAVPPGGGGGRKRRTRAEKDTRRRRILLSDGRLLIPANDEEYRAAVEAIIADFAANRQEQPAPPRRRRKRLAKAVVPPQPVPMLPAFGGLPAEFYKALEIHRQGVLNYLAVQQAWLNYWAAVDEDEAILLLVN